MVGGLWITDANFKSTIFLKNNVETDPLDVTPILYLSNGRKYTLHGVHLEPAGVAVISINQALADQGIASWATLTGYVEIQYTWPWNAICVSIEDVDVVHSVIFSFGLRSSVVGADSASLRASTAQVFEGMWWKQENNVTGFVALSNTSSEQIHASIQTEDDQSRIVAEHAVTVSPKGTKLVNLTELQQIGSRAGGVRVAYIGAESALLVNGGLEDRSVGYSAAIPFSPAAPHAKNASPMRYAELGLMTGAADPMMSFPVETVFTPYSVLRNVSTEPITVTPTLWWMEGASSHSKQLPDFAILPRRTEVLDVVSLLTAAGLKDFNGGVSLTLDVQSSPGGLLMAAGSVDQKNTYVFEVRPTAIQESQSRSLSYWDTANGDDTMVTVWNPADEDQQFVFKLSFTGGHYSFPIHLNPKALYTFNISEVINNQIPDSEGNIIPSSIHAGSAELEGTQGENEDILVAFDAGTYNVVKATCIMRCTTCHGAVNFWMQTVPFGVAVSGQKQLNSIVQYDGGGQSDITATSSWSSSAATVATVSSGLVNGLSPGGVYITATSPTETQAGTDCQPYTPPPCPRTPMQSGGGGSVVQATISITAHGQPASDDSARDAYNTANGTYNLGPIVATGGYCSIGFEASGTVTPSSYTGTVNLIRTRGGVAYTGSTGQTVLKTYPNGSPDTSQPQYEDTDPHSGTSNGVVYDLDAPGVSPGASQVGRIRYNFFEKAQFPDGTYVSNEVGFYVRVSCNWGSAGNSFRTEFSGDNTLGLGTTNTTFDLK